MHIERYCEPERALHACADLLAQHPAANSKIRRSLLRMKERPMPEDASAYVAAIHDGGVAAALGVATRDSALLLAGISGPAVRAMAHDAVQWSASLRGVVAVPSVAEAYAEEWRSIPGQKHVLRLHLCEYA